MVRTGDNPNLPVKLLRKHINNAKLLIDRYEQLERLPKNGVVVEIGVSKGFYSEEILKINNPKKLYLVEINKSHCDNLKKKFSKEINEGRVVVINESSFSAHKHFEDKYFDWIYIDGGHDYNSVLKDTYNFLPKIKEDGFMVQNDYILHDYVINVRYGTMHVINEFCLKEDWEIIYYTLATNDFKDVVLKKIKN